MKKVKTKKQLKKELDKVFSLYIRQRPADRNGMVKCFTCGKINHWKKMQCGHFMSRRHTATRWDEKNTACQCVQCNIFYEGNKYKFGKFINEKYGEGTAEMLEIKAHNKCRMGRFEYEILILEYQTKIKGD